MHLTRRYTPPAKPLCGVCILNFSDCCICRYDHVYIIFFIGTDRPTLKYLHRHVIYYIGPKYYSIGLELLDVDNVSRLEVIRENNPNKSKECAAEMLHLWLETSEDASWNKLIQALRQPHVGLLFLASEIEKVLLKEEDISFKGMITIM